MLGEWSTRIQYAVSKDLPKGGMAAGEEKWYAGPGGNSLIEEYREHGIAGDISGLGVSWWDSRAKGFHVVWCDSTDPAGCKVLNGLGRWEDNDLVLASKDTVDGRKVNFKEIFSEISATSFTQSIYTGEGDGELKLLVTIRATRKTP